MSATVSQKYHDATSGRIFHFNDERDFVDEAGEKVTGKFNLRDQALPDWLHAWVQDRLVTDFGLQKMKTKSGVDIFVSENALNSPEKLLVLCCGSGRIFAGLWSVGVCVYRGLNAGSVFPMIDKARERNMEVIVLNPNTESHHVTKVFNDHIIPGNPREIWMVAHSMGGYGTCCLLNEHPEWCMEHFKAIAFTDAVEDDVKVPEAWAKERIINWRCSKEEVNKDIGRRGDVGQARSAGTTDHPLSTFMAFDHIWTFFDEMASK